MTITVTDIDQGPYIATGAAQTVGYTFMTLTDAEISVYYDAGMGRVLIDPALHVVTPNKNVDGSAKEGGSVELDVGAAPSGADIYLRAAPRDDRDIVWSDVGSRLRNLNDENDRAVLRYLVLASEVQSTSDRLDAAIAEAGDALGNINKLDKTKGLTDLLDKAAGRASLQAPRMLTAEMYGGVLATAANAALMSGLPLHQHADADLVIDMTPYLASATTEAERYGVVLSVLRWAQKIVGPSNYKTILQLPDGLTDIGASGNFNLSGKDGRKVTFSARLTPEFINITSISSVAGVGSERIVTVGLGSALPARVVPDYILGMQELDGNNDIGFFEGGIRVATIAPDRLSFTFKRLFSVAPTDPTTITNGGSVNTRPRSSLVVPYSSFIGAWESAANEGMFTLRDGAQVDSRWIGWGAKNTGAEGCIVQVVGATSRWASLDWECWIGAGDRAMRGTFGGDININRACLGADSRTTSSYIVGMQGYGTLQMTRCSLGGGRNGCVEVANGGSGYFGQCNYHGGTIACITARQASILCYPGKAFGAARGVFATDDGVILGGNTVTSLTTYRNTMGCDAKRGGRVIGPLVSSGDVAASWARPDMTRDSGTYTTRDVNPIDGGRQVTVPNNAIRQATLRGTTGAIQITSRSSIIQTFIATVAGAAVNGGYFDTVKLGSDARDSIAAGATSLANGATNLTPLAAALPGTPINAGRMTYGIWANAGQPFLQIVNEDGGDRTLDIIVSGDLELGAFA